MCGIFAIFNSTLSDEDLRKLMIRCSQRLRHRGPDWSGYQIHNNHGIAHERLAIIDPDSGSQPLVSPCGNVIVAANGEIYNYMALYNELAEDGFRYVPRTGSDCEVVIPLYQKYGMDFVHKLRGMFSFVIYDKKVDEFFAVRDQMGITPLYYGHSADGSVWFSSEMKALHDNCATYHQAPPGKYFSSKTNDFVQWWNPSWLTAVEPPSNEVNLSELRSHFINAVRRRMMSDVPWGVLLSGGLDSSLVASIACRLHQQRARRENTGFVGQRLHSFTIGLENSPDLKAAKDVAEFLGTVHHGYTYTLQEGLDAISEVIYHLETYDVTTVRASTPMFLMSRKIKAMGVKMVLSGEGADEILGGYLYFHHAPNGKEFFEETRDKVTRLHLYDCLRANKSTSAWGVEVRVPFLDMDFMDYSMELDAECKMPSKAPRKIEKYILRKAFDTPEEPYLPNHILWRQKEQFSDGVGYGWIDALRDVAEASVTDAQMANAAHRFPYATPATKEAYRYREIFESHFPGHAAAQTVPNEASIACSTARAMEWHESFKNRADPSGRAVAGVHNDEYNEKWTIEGAANGNGDAPVKKAAAAAAAAELTNGNAKRQRVA